MNYFLALQHTYDSIEISLFNGLDLITKTSEGKKNASKNIVALVDTMLQDNNVSFKDLLFFTANQGPGPFTTLRVVIASVNGLAFASQKKLIGIDGLDALVQEDEKNQKALSAMLSSFSGKIFYAPENATPEELKEAEKKSFHVNDLNPLVQKKKHDITVALLNAFSGDVYFAIKDKTTIEKGCENTTSLLIRLQKKFPQKKIKFIGQAVAMHEKEIKKIFVDNAKIPHNILMNCSLEYVAFMAWEKWNQKKDLTDQLLPLYLKSMKINKKH